MSQENLISEIKAKFKPDSIQSKVFDLLSDQKWHCRSCEGNTISSHQYAGGGGIQGLQRGTKTRPGLVIESKSDACNNCGKQTRWDRWTGEIKTSNAATNIPKKLVQKILDFYSYTDVIEQRKRAAHELDKDFVIYMDWR